MINIGVLVDRGVTAVLRPDTDETGIEGADLSILTFPRDK